MKTAGVVIRKWCARPPIHLHEHSTSRDQPFLRQSQQSAIETTAANRDR